MAVTKQIADPVYLAQVTSGNDGTVSPGGDAPVSGSDAAAVALEAYEAALADGSSLEEAAGVAFDAALTLQVPGGLRGENQWRGHGARTLYALRDVIGANLEGHLGWGFALDQCWVLWRYCLGLTPAMRRKAREKCEASV